MADDHIRRCIGEVANGSKKLQNRMVKDVVEMCDLLKALKKLIDEKLQPRDIEDLRFREGLKQHFGDIYWSLKLHVVFHLGPDDFEHQTIADSKLEEVGRLVGLREKELNLLPDQRHAIDPGSKVLEIVSDITSRNAPRGSKGHAHEVMCTAKDLLSTLSSKNRFKPKVLATVEHNDKWFVGSSMAVSHFLRPLCLHRRIVNFTKALRKAIIFFQPLDTVDNRQKNNWSFSAYFTKRQCTMSKALCQSCKMMFKNLLGFISSDDPTENLGEGDVQLGACAEYCPVDQILADDVELALSEYESQFIDALLQRNRDRCSVLFREFEIIARKCSVAYDSEDVNFQRYVYREIRHKVHIFGLKPECNHHF